MGPERLQEMGSYLTLEKLEKMMRPFAMPAEDFPPPSTPQGFSGYFLKSAAVLERLVNLWPFHKHGNTNGTILNSFLLTSVCLSSIDKSPLFYVILEMYLQKNDVEGGQDHKLPITGPEGLQEIG